MKGRHPKPAHLRQNRTKKVGRAVLSMVPPTEPRDVPEIPNPDGRGWHPLTVEAWERAWRSPMAAMWLESDVDALGRLAVAWDEFNKRPDPKTLAEIRLQSSAFGLTPLDRSRLQWEVSRADDAEQKKQRRDPRRVSGDPRAVLAAVK